MLEKTDTAAKRHLKAVPVRAQKEKRRAVGKASFSLEHTYNHVQNVGRNMDG